MKRFWSKVKEILHRIDDLVTFLCAKGSWSIKAHEQMVLDAALKILDEGSRNLIGQQMKQAYFFQRMNDRINSIFFYDANDDFRLPNQALSDLLIKVRFRIEGRQQTANVIIYNGYLNAIELKKPAKFYLDKKLEIIDAEIGKPGQSYTGVIDRAAHGKSEFDN